MLSKEVGVSSQAGNSSPEFLFSEGKVLSDETAGGGNLDGNPNINWKLVGERQEEMDGILYSNMPQSERITELNKLIEKWDDGQGLAYTYMSGHTLDDLEFHGNAEGAVFAASSLRRAKLSGANFQKAVLSLAALEGVRAQGANFSNAVMTAASMTGEFSGSRWIEAILNYAQMGGDFRSSNLVGAHVVSVGFVKSVNLAGSIFDGARLMVEPQSPTLEGFLQKLTRASGIESELIRQQIVVPLIYRKYAGLPGTVFDKSDLGRLQTAYMEDVSFPGSEMSNYILRGATFNRVNATGMTAVSAVMAGAVMRETDVTGSNLMSSSMAGVIAIKSHLGWAVSPGITSGMVSIGSSMKAGVLPGGAIEVVNGKDENPETPAEDRGLLRRVHIKQLSPPVRRNIRHLLSKLNTPKSQPQLPEPEGRRQNTS
jgi:uncharacterized protein YjbI with pentapeptide repeats